MSNERKKIALGMKCGDCLHYKEIKKFDDICLKLGVGRKADAPAKCFQPNYYRLNSVKKKEAVSEITDAVSGLRPSQLRVLAFTLVKSSNLLERKGFSFGQKVYFSLDGLDYLSHYFKGYIIGVNGDNIIITARLKKATRNTTLQLLSKSILSAKQFAKKKKELLKANRITMKKENIWLFIKVKPLAELIDKKGCLKIDIEDPESEKLKKYEPPTIDTVPQEWFDKNKKHKVKRTKEIIPLTDITEVDSLSKTGTRKVKRRSKK